MRVLLASGERFSGIIVEALVRDGHEVVSVISPFKGVYDRQFKGPRFLYYDLRGWDILKHCHKKKIEFRVSRQLDDGAIRALIKSSKPDLLLLFGWPSLLTEETLDLFPRGAMNIHPSQLPKLRGADPIFTIVDKQIAGFGLTFHKVTQELDAGPVYLKIPLIYWECDSYDDLYFTVLKNIGRYLPKAMAEMVRNPAGQAQRGESSTAAGFRKSLRLLDVLTTCQKTVRRTLACYSHHPMITAAGDKLIYFSRCRQLSRFQPSFQGPGLVQEVGPFSLVTTLADGVVKLSGIRLPGVPYWQTPLRLAAICRPGYRLTEPAAIKELLKQRRT